MYYDKLDELQQKFRTAKKTTSQNWPTDAVNNYFGEHKSDNFKNLSNRIDVVDAQLEALNASAALYCFCGALFGAFVGVFLAAYLTGAL